MAVGGKRRVLKEETQEDTTREQKPLNNIKTKSQNPDGAIYCNGGIRYINSHSRQMFEATLEECSIFKKIVESIKDLVNDVNVETSPTGLICALHSQGSRSKPWTAHMWRWCP